MTTYTRLLSNRTYKGLFKHCVQSTSCSSQFEQFSHKEVQAVAVQSITVLSVYNNNTTTYKAP